MSLRVYEVSANTVATAGEPLLPMTPGGPPAGAEPLGAGSVGRPMAVERNRPARLGKSLILLGIIVLRRSGVNDGRSQPHHPPFNPPTPAATRRNYCRLEKWEGFPGGVLPC